MAPQSQRTEATADLLWLAYKLSDPAWDVFPDDRVGVCTVLKSFSLFWVLRLNPHVECQFFFAASRLPRSRGSGLGQRSPAKVAAAENAVEDFCNAKGDPYMALTTSPEVLGGCHIFSVFSCAP